MAGWKKGRKTVVVRRHHRIHCASVAPTLVAPELPDEVEFDRYELLMSVGRSLAMRMASRRLIKSLAAGRSPLLHHIVDDTAAPFRLSEEVRDLNDGALSSLSHDIGVGVSGLHMEAMGFTWRGNGKELLEKGMRFPDYVWDTGVASGGVVLSEAKGTTAADSTFVAIDGRAREGMFGQVEPRIGTKTLDGLDISSGYAFGVFAAGGKQACTTAYEAMDFTGASRTVPGDMPSASILRSHFAGVFRLLGLDSEEAEADLMKGRVRFAAFGDGTLEFLVPERERRSGAVRSIMFDTVTMPALEARVAARALDLRFGTGDAPSDRRMLFPRFARRTERLPRGVLALAPDGLAVVSTHGRRGPSLSWKPEVGFIPAD